MYYDIPLITTTDLESFDGLTIDGGSYLRNIIIEQYADQRPYATQRPAIALVQDASDTVTDTEGRGIYYWESAAADYFVNNDTIYKGTYSTTIGTITAGREPGTFLEAGGKLVFLDHENGEGWTITTGGTLTQIVDADFPTTLAGGGVSLDGYLFVMDNDAVIYNSDLDDPEAWTAINFITSEREEDKGIYLTKHHDHIVAFGSKTVEFFYDAGNPVGSPLNRRADIAYRIGALDKNSVWPIGDKVYFIGVGPSGDMGLYVLDQFKVQEVSTPTISRWITYQTVFNNFKFIVCGNKINGHEFIHLTMMYDEGGDYTPRHTLVFDSTFGYWTVFDSAFLYTTVAIPVMSWTDRTGSEKRQGRGILANGDVYQYLNSVNPTDGAIDVLYVATGYVATDYVQDLGGSDIVNIPTTIITPEFDGGHSNNKFMHKLELVGHRISGTTATGSVTISWTNDHYNNYSSTQSLPLDTTNHRSKIHRLGRFNRRAFKLEYSGNQRLRLEGLRVLVGESDYA